MKIGKCRKRPLGDFLPIEYGKKYLISASNLSLLYSLSLFLSFFLAFCVYTALVERYALLILHVYTLI